MKKYIVLITLYLVMISSTVRADAYTNLVRIDCNEDLEYLSIYPLSFYGRKLQDELERNSLNILKKHNLLDLSSLIHPRGDLPIYGFDFKAYRQTCVLGDKKYDIMLTPSMANQGDCFQYESFRLSIATNDKILVDDMLFSDCGKRIISRLDVIADYEEIVIWDSTVDFKTYLYNEPDFEPLTTVGIHGKHYAEIGLAEREL